MRTLGLALVAAMLHTSSPFHWPLSTVVGTGAQSSPPFADRHTREVPVYTTDGLTGSSVSGVMNGVPSPEGNAGMRDRKPLEPIARNTCVL